MKRKTLLMLLACSFVVISVDIAYHKMKRDATAFRPENSDNLLAVSQVWKAASDFYGYFELLPEDFDWDAQYQEAFHQAAKAEDGYEYYRTLSRFVAALQDGHQAVVPPDSQIFGALPFAFSYIEGDYYLIATGDRQVPLYSKLDKIDGREAKAYLEEEIGPTVGLQTPLARENQLIYTFTKYGKRGEEVSLEFLTPDGEQIAKKFTYDSGIGLLLGLNQKVQTAEVFAQPKELLHSSHIFTLRKADPAKPIEETVLILEVKTMLLDGREELINRILPLVSRSKGCIIDLRSCDGGNSFNGQAVLYPFVENDVIGAAPTTESFQQVKVGYYMMWAQMVNQLSEMPGGSEAQEQLGEYLRQFPPEVLENGQKMLQGRYTTGAEDELAQMIKEYISSNLMMETTEEDDLLPWVNLPKVNVPAAVLVYHTSGSATDNTADIAKAWGLPLIGTHTKGATGDLMIISLANGWRVAFSSQRTLASDGSDIWNRGIAADIQADYNLADLKEGVDTPLQAAIVYLQNKGDGAQGPQ